jgi:hypothetical protein
LVNADPFRAELIAILAELTGDLEPSMSPIGSSFLETSVFLLEEVEIDGDLSAVVGSWLRNEREGASLNALALPLNAVLHEGGGWSAGEDVLYQHTPSWPQLQDAAAEALRVFRQPDE